MHRSAQMEQFSLAYVRAVAAASGYTLYKPEVDDDSVDLVVTASGDTGLRRRPRVELQVKCTAADLISNGVIKFPLRIKNYDDLRGEDLILPRLLVVVLVPRDVADWLEQSESQLVMRRCAYWASVRGLPETENAETVTVDVPRHQVFSMEELSGIMREAGQGGAR